MNRFSIARIFKRFLGKIRSIFFSKWYGFKGKNIQIGKGVEIICPEYVEVGSNTGIRNYVEIFAVPTIPGIIPRVKIGNNCALGKRTIIGCANEVVLEDSVRVGPNVHFSDRGHKFDDVSIPMVPIITESKGPIYIGQETWIGSGAQIMSGVTIGKRCVIAAGAIVTKSFPDYCVIAGNPAKIVKQYNFDKKQWVRVI